MKVSIIEDNETIRKKEKVIRTLVGYIRNIHVFNSVAEESELEQINLTGLFAQHAKPGSTDVNLGLLTLSSLQKLSDETSAHYVYCRVLCEELGELPIMYDDDGNFHIIKTMDC